MQWEIHVHLGRQLEGCLSDPTEGGNFPGAGNLHDNEIDSVVLIGEEPQKGIKPSFAGNA